MRYYQVWGWLLLTRMSNHGIIFYDKNVLYQIMQSRLFLLNKQNILLSIENNFSTYESTKMFSVHYIIYMLLFSCIIVVIVHIFGTICGTIYRWNMQESTTYITPFNITIAKDRMLGKITIFYYFFMNEFNYVNI